MTKREWSDGDVVRHASFGRGVVSGKGRFGSWTLVRFDDGMSRRVRAEDLSDPTHKDDAWVPETVDDGVDEAYMLENELDRLHANGESESPRARDVVVDLGTAYLHDGEVMRAIGVLEGAAHLIGSIEGRRTSRYGRAKERLGDARSRVDVVEAQDDYADALWAYGSSLGTDSIECRRVRRRMRSPRDARLTPPGTVPFREGPSKRLTYRASGPTHVIGDGIDAMDARRVIEAMRFGVIPRIACPGAIERITVGRDRDLDSVRHWLASDVGSLTMVGDYGVGKTHMVEAIDSIALRSGWAVARVDLDEDVSLDEPKSLYAAIVDDLRYVDDNELKGFRDLLRKVASEDTGKFASHPFLGNVIKGLRDGDIEEDELLWIEGRLDDTRPWKGTHTIRDADLMAIADRGILLDVKRDEVYARAHDDGERELLRGHRFIPSTRSGFMVRRRKRSVHRRRRYRQLHHSSTCASDYCNVLSGIGNALMSIGKEGLLLLVDEAESVDTMWRTKHRDEMAWNTVSALHLMSENDGSLVRESNEMDRLVRNHGHLTGLRYSGHRERVPFMSYDWAGMKVVFCLTPVENVLDEVPFDRIPSIELENVDVTHVAEAFENVRSMYDLAYGIDTSDVTMDDVVVESFRMDGTRVGIKSMIEMLDIHRFGGRG